MAKIIFHIVFILLFIAAVGCSIYFLTGSGTGEIARLRTEIDKLGKQNKDLAENNSRLASDLEKQSTYNGRLEKGLEELSIGAGSAGKDIQDAIGRIRELKELAKEITN